MSGDVSTHLQALYHSGQISGYIHSKLTDGPLKTGWIEQGLLSKGLKGKLRDKHNQESLVIPADRFARLARDHSGWNQAALVLIGSKGLVGGKFVAIVFGPQGSQSIIAFQIQKTSPYDIIKFLLQNVLGKKVTQHFEEPNLDYIEQVIPKITPQYIPPGGDKADSNHRTYPFLTNYEKTKIIGLRANQLSKGSVPFIAVPKHITDVRDIARLELEQKRLPFIVKRPLPNGQFEYWRLADLLIL